MIRQLRCFYQQTKRSSHFYFILWALVPRYTTKKMTKSAWIGTIEIAMLRIAIIFVLFVGDASMFTVYGDNQKQLHSKNVSTVVSSFIAIGI